MRTGTIGVDTDGNYYMQYKGGSWRRAEERECLHCGRPFIYVLAKNIGIYCSQRCNSKENAKRLSRKRTTKRCPICGDLFQVTPSQLRTGRHPTCGKPSCITQHRSEAMRREWLVRDHQLKPIRHGTATGYQRGCRCDDCREAIRIANHRWYVARRLKVK
jgi:hypothetical protein